MAKKGARAASDNSNQLVYYILFFALGALFAAGILAVNDGISGNVVEDFSAFNANDVAEGYANVRAVQEPGVDLEEAAIETNLEAESAISNLNNPIEREIFSRLVREDIQDIVSALSFKKQIQDELGAEDVKVTLSEQGEWEVTSVTVGGQTLEAQQRDIEEYYINGPTQGTMMVHETVTHTGKPVAVEVLAATGDLDGHSASVDDIEGHSLTIDDVEGHSLTIDDIESHGL